MSFDDATALARLVLAGGPAQCRRQLLDRHGSPAAALAAGAGAWRASGLDPAQIAVLQDPAIGEALARTRDWLQVPGHHLVGWHDADYPAPLRTISSPPLALFIDGDPALLWRPAVAVVDVLLKRIALAGTPSLASLQVAFALAFLLMLSWQLLRQGRGTARLDLRNFAAGLLLGVLNFGNIVFYVRAHQALPGNPSVVFATMNIGVVVLGTAVGVLAFGEKTSRWNRFAIGLAIGAIGLIAAAPKS